MNLAQLQQSLLTPNADLPSYLSHISQSDIDSGAIFFILGTWYAALGEFSGSHSQIPQRALYLSDKPNLCASFLHIFMTLDQDQLLYSMVPYFHELLEQTMSLVNKEHKAQILQAYEAFKRNSAQLVSADNLFYIKMEHMTLQEAITPSCGQNSQHSTKVRRDIKL